MSTVNQYLVLAKASDGQVVAKQDTFLNHFAPNTMNTTKITTAVFSSADSSKLAYVTSEGSLQGAFGGHLLVVDMVSKQLSKVYQEPWFVSGGVAFNTNDTLIATGN